MTDSELKTVFEGLVFSILRQTVHDRRGRPSEVEFVKAPSVVRVYPLSADKKSFFFISEKRPGTDKRILRVVSGGIDAGEACVDAAKRELSEEIGICADRFEKFHTSRQSLKMLNEVHHVVAFGAVQAHAPRLEPLEDINMVEIPVENVESLIWNDAFAEDSVSFSLLKLLKRLQ